MEQQPQEDFDSTQDKQEIGDLQGSEDPKVTDEIEKQKRESDDEETGSLL